MRRKIKSFVVLILTLCVFFLTGVKTFENILMVKAETVGDAAVIEVRSETDLQQNHNVSQYLITDDGARKLTTKTTCPPEPTTKPTCPPKPTTKPTCPPEPTTKPTCPPKPTTKPTCPPEPTTKPTTKPTSSTEATTPSKSETTLESSGISTTRETTMESSIVETTLPASSSTIETTRESLPDDSVKPTNITVPSDSEGSLSVENPTSLAAGKLDADRSEAERVAGTSIVKTGENEQGIFWYKLFIVTGAGGLGGLVYLLIKLKRSHD